MKTHGFFFYNCQIIFVTSKITNPINPKIINVCPKCNKRIKKNLKIKV